MNILLINHYAGSLSLGMEFRQFYLAKRWIKNNNVLIVTASFHHLRNYNPTIIKSTFREVDGIKFFFVKTTAYSKNNLLRLVNIVLFLINLMRYSNKITKSFRPDVVITSSTYVFDIWVAKRIANISNAKLVFEIPDLWPLALIELNVLKTWHPIIMFMKLSEWFAYRTSDLIVSVLPNCQNYMVNKGMNPTKFNYIPNGIDTDEWVVECNLPEEIMRFINKIKLNHSKIICYIGSHSVANELSPLLYAFKELKSYPVQLLFVGNGVNKRSIVSLSESLNLDNVKFLDKINKSQIPKLLEFVDILYVGLKKVHVFKYGISPNKLFDYMMAGKPIIQAINCSNDIVRKARCGLTIEPGNIQQLVRSIKFLTNLPREKIVEMGLNGKRYCLENHNYNLLAKKYFNVLIK